VKKYTECGLYIVKDSFFRDYAKPNWVQNKGESRPHYYAIEDNGLLWLIPMTSRTESVKAKIAKEEAKRGEGNCIFYHTGFIAGVERGFKIGDMFPVTERHILRAYTVNGALYIVKTTALNRELRSRAVKFLALLKSGKMQDRLGVLDTAKRLRAER
jgi:hypothetical protein